MSLILEKHSIIKQGVKDTVISGKHLDKLRKNKSPAFNMASWLKQSSPLCNNKKFLLSIPEHTHSEKPLISVVGIETSSKQLWEEQNPY